MKTRRQLGRAFLLALWLLGGLTWGIGPAAAQGAAQTVRLSPTSLTIAPDGVGALAVEIVAAADLYAIDVSLNFDPTLVEVLDDDPNWEGVQVSLGTLLDPGFVVINQVDNTLGRVQLVMTQLAPSLPKEGTGTLIVLRLRAKGKIGRGAITFQRVQLSTEIGVAHDAAPQAGEVVIAANAPAITAIPSQAPGTPMPTPAATTSAPILPTATPAAPLIENAAAPTATRAPDAAPTLAPTLPPTAAPTAVAPTRLPSTLAPTAAELPPAVAEPSPTPTEAVAIAALAPTAAAPTVQAAAPTDLPQPQAAAARRTNLLLVTGAAALVLALAAGFLLGARRDV